MTENPPSEWALKEACKRLGECYASWVIGRVSTWVSRAIVELARMIEKYEKEPVAPLRQEAREIVAKIYDDHESPAMARYVRAGDFDNDLLVQSAYNGLRRGMELAAAKGGA